jgi:ribosomal protein L20
MGGLAKSGIEINRKLLAAIAYHEPEIFASLVKQSGLAH